MVIRVAAHRAAHCVMSGAGLPCVLRATTDFAYVRMHGPDHHHLYAGSYPARRSAVVGRAVWRAGRASGYRGRRGAAAVRVGFSTSSSVGEPLVSTRL